MTTVLSSNVQACASRRNNDAIVSVAQFSLSQHQFFRAEIVVRGKKSIVSVARWKICPMVRGAPDKPWSLARIALQRS